MRTSFNLNFERGRLNLVPPILAKWSLFLSPFVPVLSDRSFGGVSVLWYFSAGQMEKREKTLMWREIWSNKTGCKRGRHFFRPAEEKKKCRSISQRKGEAAKLLIDQQCMDNKRTEPAMNISSLFLSRLILKWLRAKSVPKLTLISREKLIYLAVWSRLSRRRILWNFIKNAAEDFLLSLTQAMSIRATTQLIRTTAIFCTLWKSVLQTIHDRKEIVISPQQLVTRKFVGSNDTRLVSSIFNIFPNDGHKSEIREIIINYYAKLLTL